MARTSKVEACIFCEKLPCECNASAKPKAAPKKRQSQKTETVKTDSDPFTEQSKQPNRFKKQVKEAPELPQEQLELHQAIRNLEDLLSSQEKMRQAHILNPTRPVEIDRRLVEWRDRNEKV